MTGLWVTRKTQLGEREIRFSLACCLL